MPEARFETGTLTGRPSRGRRRWLLLLVLVLATAWFGRFAWLRVTLRPTPRFDYWAAQIEALDPPGPDAVSTDVGAAALMNRPFETMPPLLGAIAFHPRQVLSGDWDVSREGVRIVDEVFRSGTFQTCRDALAAALSSGWRPDGDPLEQEGGYAWQSEPHLWACWLSAHSRWARHELGAPDIETEDWLIMLRLGRQVRRTQTAFAWQVEASVLGAFCNAVLRGFHDAPPKFDVGVFIRSARAIVGPYPAREAVLAGERLRSHAVLETCFVREGGDWVDVSEYAALLDQGLVPGGLSKPSRWWNLASPLFVGLGRARRCADDYYTACARDEVTEYLFEDPRRVRSSRFHGRVADAATPLILSLDAPGAIASTYAAREQFELTLAMLALAAYRHARGEYPASLDALMPDLLDRLPIAADGAALRYSRTAAGYELYGLHQRIAQTRPEGMTR